MWFQILYTHALFNLFSDDGSWINFIIEIYSFLRYMLKMTMWVRTRHLYADVLVTINSN